MYKSQTPHSCHEEYPTSSMEEVGMAFGITRKRIREIEALALRKVEKSIGLDKLKKYTRKKSVRTKK